MALSGGLNLPRLYVPRLTTPTVHYPSAFSASPLAAGILVGGQGIAHGIDAAQRQSQFDQQFAAQQAMNAPRLAMENLALQQAQYQHGPQLLQDLAARDQAQQDYLGNYQPTSPGPDVEQTTSGRLPFAVEGPRPATVDDTMTALQSGDATGAAQDTVPGAGPVDESGQPTGQQTSPHTWTVPGQPVQNPPPSLSGLLKAQPLVQGALQRLAGVGIGTNPAATYQTMQQRQQTLDAQKLLESGMDALGTAKTPADRFAALMTMEKAHIRLGGKGASGYDKLAALGDTEAQRDDNESLLKDIPPDALGRLLGGTPQAADITAVADAVQKHPGAGYGKKLSGDILTHLMKDPDLNAFTTAYQSAVANGADPHQALLAATITSPTGAGKAVKTDVLGIIAPEFIGQAEAAKEKGKLQGEAEANPTKGDLEAERLKTERLRQGEIQARTEGLTGKGPKEADPLKQLDQIDKQIDRISKEDLPEEDRDQQFAGLRAMRASVLQKAGQKTGTEIPGSTKSVGFADLEPSTQMARLTDALKGLPRDQRTDKPTVAKQFRSYVLSHLFRGQDPASLGESDQQRALAEIDAMMARQFPK